MRVLVVDDNAPLAENLAEMLIHEGHDADFETSPEAALARPECFDAYVLDIAMPGIDGWQLRATLRQRCPEASIVLMTAYSDHGVRPKGERHVPLSKPVPFARLLERIES